MQWKTENPTITEVSDMAESTAELIFDNFNGYMEAAKRVIDTYGGDVADLGLLALRIDAASEIVLPAVFSFILAVVAVKARNLIFRRVSLYYVTTKGFAARSRYEDNFVNKFFNISTNIVPDDKIEMAKSTFMPINWGSPLPYIPIVLSAVSVGCAIKVINIWAWVGMFYPEAYAIHLFILK